jgi:hypothetical protein
MPAASPLRRRATLCRGTRRRIGEATRQVSVLLTHRLLQREDMGQRREVRAQMLSSSATPRSAYAIRHCCRASRQLGQNGVAKKGDLVCSGRLVEPLTEDVVPLHVGSVDTELPSLFLNATSTVFGMPPSFTRLRTSSHCRMLVSRFRGPRRIPPPGEGITLSSGFRRLRPVLSGQWASILSRGGGL